MDNKTKSLGLYIHIPFCKAKCYYCDFNSYAGMNDIVPAYFNALKKEIAEYGKKLRDCSIGTIFIGGGTPSLVNAGYINDLMDTCFKNFRIEEGAEITTESNPGTLSYEKLLAYKSSGINRLSMGLQAWQNKLLQEIGRIHLVEDFIKNFEQAEKVGFKNINVDLIFGLPHQSLRDWTETLQNVIELNPSHISCYSLKIEDGTVFGEKYHSGELIPIDDDADREMYYRAVRLLGENGYNHYEISNFSKPGLECRHNLIYWKAEEYAGVGAGAHSYLYGKRFNNVTHVDEYISSVLKDEIHIENIQGIDKNEQVSEYLILGLRLLKGVNEAEFQKRFGMDLFEVYGKQIQKMLKKGLLKSEGDRICLTPLGLDLANEVFVEFI